MRPADDAIPAEKVSALQPSTIQSTTDRVWTRRVTVIFWIATIVFGFLQAWAGRFTMVNDCISFLDLGDAYFRGDWKMVVNGYYFPLWAWFLGAAMFIVRPSAYWEYFVVQLVNLVVLLLAAGFFEFFLRELIRDHRARIAHRPGSVVWPDWVWRTLGYSLFLWSSLALIGISETNPDLLVAALIYLSAGIVLRIHSGRAGRIAFIALGVVLGLAYLAKAAMFPLAFVFLGVAAFAAAGGRRPSPRAIAGLAAFLLLAGPYALVLSLNRGRFDFGDSGRLNYEWLVNGAPSRHWRGEPVGSGRPLHPTRRLLETPALYEFDRPGAATYPLWYDISYWYEGLRVHFRPSRQIAVLTKNVSDILSLLLGLNGVLVIGFVLLVAFRGPGDSLLRELSDYWVLFIPAVAGLGLYALVSVVPRYVAPFLVLLAMGALCAVRIPASDPTRRFGMALAVLFAAMVFSPVGPGAFPKHYRSVRTLFRTEPSHEHVFWQVADGLRRMGLSPRDRVATLEYANIDHVHWARLARARIIAEIYFKPERAPLAANDFWRIDPWKRSRAIAAFATTGARMIVSDREPPRSETAGWTRIGETGYYVYWLEGPGGKKRRAFFSVGGVARRGDYSKGFIGPSGHSNCES